MGTQGYRHPFLQLPPMKRKLSSDKCVHEYMSKDIKKKKIIWSCQLYEKLGSDRILARILLCGLTVD